MKLEKDTWTKDETGKDQYLTGRGRVYLWETEERGTRFTSSFGPDNDDSFTGFVPLTQDREEVKIAALKQAAHYWLKGPMDSKARKILSA